MSETELAFIWGAVSIMGFVVAGLGLIEGLYIGVAGAIAVGLVFVAPAWVSLFVFVALVALAIPITRVTLRRTRYYGSPSATGMDSYIGRVGIVTSPIEDSAHPGKIQVDGEHFRASIMFDHHGPAHLGTRVLVDRVDGSLLVVTPQKALRERYARGEISHAELERLLKEDLR